MYSPGLSAMKSTDKLIEKYCKDADVFVYVCNGVSTLERPVSQRFVTFVSTGIDRIRDISIIAGYIKPIYVILPLP